MFSTGVLQQFFLAKSILKCQDSGDPVTPLCFFCPPTNNAVSPGRAKKRGTDIPEGTLEGPPENIDTDLPRQNKGVTPSLCLWGLRR